ncbi:peptide deformylase [Niabella aquatica]
MRRKIIAYGHSVLKQKCKEISRDFPQLDLLIADMWETMIKADGCGLSASQIGFPIRLFIVDSKTTFENLDEPDRQIYYGKEDKGIMETFINAKIIERSLETLEDEEGCLSIPGLSRKVVRNQTIKIAYSNQYFDRKIKIFGGTTARMIQHEFDHTEGILYLDYLKPLTKKLMESKLRKIMKGQIHPKYPMKFG